MKTSQSRFIQAVLLVIIFSFCKNAFAQNSSKTDSVIKIIMSDEHVTDMNDHGTELILNGNFSAASTFYNDEIKKDESSKAAYFGRGVVNWAMSDTMNACKDWSALLALGDTAAFKLLDGRCHGAMIVDDDVIPKTKYHKMFSVEKNNNKANSTNANARIFADEMPEYPGGNSALIIYLSHSIKYPDAARSKKVEGTVYVNFIVSSKGKILFPHVVRGIGSGCDEEALRVIRSMSGWKPGKQKGKPVLVQYNIPVQFHLK